MNENELHQEEQGTIIPRIFIGLGGAGSRIVDRIAGRAARLDNWNSQLCSLTHFISIDTNELDQHKLKSIPSGNRINIASFDKAKVIENFRRSEDKQALQWIDKFYQPRPGHKPGAGQIRVESRLGFFYHSTEIRQRLRSLVEDSLRAGITWRQNNPPKVDVYLFCSLAGGTGSGSFLSAAYLIDDIIKTQHWQPRVIGNLLLSTMMTDKVGPELHSDIHANTYAALKELEHLTKLDYKQVKDEGRTEEAFVYCRDANNPASIPSVETRPFFMSFIFDRPKHLSLYDGEAAVADTAFLQVFTPLIDNLAGELDNYEKKIEGLTRFPGSLRDVGLGYTKNFGAYGAAVMVLPGEELLEYCSLRFAAQALRRQITFGLDEVDASDERAVALAKLAVNYDDPKFLRMADEDRERVINRAFVQSVRELARQDIAMELPQGVWAQLVESIDEGKQVGLDNEGLPIRNESLIKQIERKLKESRDVLLDKIAIKERAFTFLKESVNQYIEHVSRLNEEIRTAKAFVNENLSGLEMAAKEGELIAQLKLDPLTERYLTIQLLDICEQKWIPEADSLLRKVEVNDIGNAKVRERLERELYANLQEVAAKRAGLFGNKHEDFLNTRDEAQGYYRGVAAAAKKTFDANIRLRQLRALLEYLQRRSKQYAGLSSRMDGLVKELDRQAERLRRGEAVLSPAMALRVEVFETLEEPRQRIWDKVFRALFIDDGRYITTFDRQLLSETISSELKPVVTDGKAVDKPLERTVVDLEQALCRLGKERLSPGILGKEQGLDLVRGLELEAQLLLKAKKPANETVSAKEVADYRNKKFRALEQLAGTLARVNTAEANALDDGVVVNRTRQLIIGQLGDTNAAETFYRELKDILTQSGRQVKTDTWYDPRLIIVHDVELPIPLYYFPAIIGDIESAYIQAAQDEKRAYNLHTDMNWEKSLPNLNPRASEITVDWTLKTLAKALILRIIRKRIEDGQYAWFFKENDADPLGKHLSAVLYKLGEMYKNESLQKAMQECLDKAQQSLNENMAERQQRVLNGLTEYLTAMSRGELKGELEEDDIREVMLERPVIKALIAILEKGVDIVSDLSTSTKKPIRTIDFG